MSSIENIWDILVKNNFRVSTDTRKNISGSVFFALKGENFDGKTFAREAKEKGAVEVVTENALEILQKLARRYRDTFAIPVIAIGGSNGKTTTKELIRKALEIKYKTYATEENLNNHIGVPLSIFAMDKSVEIGVFEIGANHLGEHTLLLEILNPTHVFVTNDGLDHLEGFGSPEGVMKANKEIIDWAKKNNRRVIERVNNQFKITSPLPLTITYNNIEYKTHLFGSYNLENIGWAIGVASEFGIDIDTALQAITRYTPQSYRSQFLIKEGVNLIMDCYNANPTSMMLALQSFVKSTNKPQGIILGDMLELGSFTEQEHEKILEFVSKQDLETVVLIGNNFKKALNKNGFKNFWFENSDSAREWFQKQNFKNYTILIKGSRGMRLEKIVE